MLRCPPFLPGTIDGNLQDSSLFLCIHLERREKRRSHIQNKPHKTTTLPFSQNRTPSRPADQKPPPIHIKHLIKPKNPPTPPPPPPPPPISTSRQPTKYSKYLAYNNQTTDQIPTTKTPSLKTPQPTRYQYPTTRAQPPTSPQENAHHPPPPPPQTPPPPPPPPPSEYPFHDLLSCSPRHRRMRPTKTTGLFEEARAPFLFAPFRPFPLFSLIPSGTACCCPQVRRDSPLCLPSFSNVTSHRSHEDYHFKAARRPVPFFFFFPSFMDFFFF